MTPRGAQVAALCLVTVLGLGACSDEDAGETAPPEGDTSSASPSAAGSPDESPSPSSAVDLASAEPATGPAGKVELAQIRFPKGSEVLYRSSVTVDAGRLRDLMTTSLTYLREISESRDIDRAARSMVRRSVPGDAWEIVGKVTVDDVEGVVLDHRAGADLGRRFIAFYGDDRVSLTVSSRDAGREAVHEEFAAVLATLRWR